MLDEAVSVRINKRKEVEVKRQHQIWTYDASTEFKVNIFYINQPETKKKINHAQKAIFLMCVFHGVDDLNAILFY